MIRTDVSVLLGVCLIMACGIYTELDREKTVRRFKASASVARVRRVVVGACDRNVRRRCRQMRGQLESGRCITDLTIE